MHHINSALLVMPRPSQKKTKPTRGTPYARTTNILEPHTFPRPTLVAEFESLVDKHSARKRRGRPRKEEPTLACSWCSKVAVQIEGQTNIFQKPVTLRKLHAGHHTPDQLMEEAEQRLSSTDDSLDLTTFNTDQLSAFGPFQHLEDRRVWFQSIQLNEPARAS
jgi:hypothetical protein